MGVPIHDILFTVFQSIFQVFLLCLSGFALSRQGIVDKPSSKFLNHVNVALFTPALLFSKCAYFLSPAKLRQLWVIPVFFVVITSMSAVVAHCLARACRLRRSQVNFATAASMFMNSNSLPVALMQSLATTVPLLKWGPDDTIDAMFGRSLTYLVVFSTLGMILRWSYGVRLLAQIDEPDPITTLPPTAYHDVDDTDQRTPLQYAPFDRSTAPLVGYETEPDIDPRDRHVWRARPLRSRLHHLRLARRFTHPHVRHSHLPAVPASLGDQSESDDSDVDTTEGDSEDTIALRSEPVDTGFSTEAEDHPPPGPVLLPTPIPSDVTPRWEQPARPPFWKRLVHAWTSLSPPLLASLLALFCVLVPPVQRVLTSKAMIPLKGALDSAGACSIPLTMLVLGGWFWVGESKHVRDGGDDRAKSLDDSQGKSKGKGKRHAPPPPPLDDVARSRVSSTASLTSLVGAVGDVIRGRGYAWTRRRGEPGEDVEAPPLATHRETEGDAPQNPPGETLTVFVTLLARMVVVPLVATPLMVLVSRMGWGGEVFEDPVFLVSSMLLIASPPALTLAQISQRASPKVDANAFSPFERLLSRTVFWAYLVLTPPLTIVSVMVGLLMIEA